MLIMTKLKYIVFERIKRQGVKQSIKRKQKRKNLRIQDSS